jgi:hypothetical protein
MALERRDVEKAKLTASILSLLVTTFIIKAIKLVEITFMIVKKSQSMQIHPVFLKFNPIAKR